MEPTSSSSIPVANNPATTKDTLSISGSSQGDNQLPADPLAGPQARNTSGAQPGRSQVTFIDILTVQESDIPPTLEWCCHCMQLIGRDLLKARTDFVCTHCKHTPCIYCTKKIYQGYIEILPQWVDLVDKII